LNSRDVQRKRDEMVCIPQRRAVQSERQPIARRRKIQVLQLGKRATDKQCSVYVLLTEAVVIHHNAEGAKVRAPFQRHPW
jgi:hypothetical protein